MARAAALSPRVRWAGLQATAALGLPGAIAAALLAAAAVLHWGATVEAVAAARALDAESALLQHRLAHPATAPRELSTQEQLAAFEHRFDSDAQIVAALANLQGTARQAGVRLEQAEFKLTREPTEPLARYVIQLALKTDYRSLRRFTRDALRALPGLALEDVTLRRTDARSTQLEAQLRLVLFLRKD